MSSIIKVDQIQLADGSTPTAADLGLNTTGTIINVQKAEINTAVSISTGGAFADVLSMNYTPVSADSTLLIEVFCAQVKKHTGGNTYVGAQFTLDGTGIQNMGANMYAFPNNDSRYVFNGRVFYSSWGTTQKTIAFQGAGGATTAEFGHQDLNTVLSVIEIAG